MEKKCDAPPCINPETVPPDSSSSPEGGGASTPVPASTSEDASAELFDMRRHFILLELQSLIHHYNEAFLQLQRTISDLDDLKEENLILASENMELLSLVEEQKKFSVSPISMALPSSSSSCTHPEEERGKSPVTAGKKETGTCTQNTSRSVFPKSISIRSTGFLSTKSYPTLGRNSRSVGARRPLRLRLPTTAVLQEGDGNGEVEVEAYSQGTAKTELCNKWGEMGWCPYAGKCQFAHGIEELRPVVRHPLYKTQICRMLGAGGGCPYGHRCHFRHAASRGSRDR